MAQILKDDVRERIINAAKEEFLEYGYKDASMRRIAFKSHMTVGNLYRYFKNKEDINVQIVSETLNLIENSIKSKTINTISFETRVFNITPDTEKLALMLDELADDLVDIYEGHKQEFNILMMHSDLNKEITQWFSSLINYLIKENYNINTNYDVLNIISNSYAVSIFSGLRTIFSDNTLTDTKLKYLIKVYFRSYISILDNRKIAG